MNFSEQKRSRKAFDTGLRCGSVGSNDETGTVMGLNGKATGCAGTIAILTVLALDPDASAPSGWWFCAGIVFRTGSLNCLSSVACARIMHPCGRNDSVGRLGGR